MKWYWWVLLIFVPLGLVAYFFYQTGRKTEDAMAKARAAKAAKAESEKDNADGAVGTGNAPVESFKERVNE